ncbi:MAG: DUF5666 domain-containing protein [Pseudomonadota bacterium]
MKSPCTRGLLTGLALAGLAGCGGAGSSLFASGGISGTGLGSVTAFGSIIINDTREFTIDASTQIFWDGTPITEAQLMQRGIGAVARIDIGDDVSADFSSGTAVTIDIGNQVKGPVTALAPLQVLGQNVLTTADSAQYQDDNPVAGLTLTAGDEVEVSGFADNAGIVLAARIERVTTGLAEWKLVGSAAAPASSGSFNIGIQEIAVPGTVTARNCSGGVVSPGDLVEVKATPDPLYSAPPDIIATVTDVECLAPGLAIPGNASSTSLRAEIEGLVNSVSPLVIAGQPVTLGAGTVFEGGTQADIGIGAKLEAEGTLDTASGVLSADRIRFRDRRVRIEAPASLPLGGSFNMLSVITVNTSALTADSDGLIAGGSGNRQVEVRGYLDANDAVIATEVRDRGAADPGQVRLRGPVGSNTCNPAIVDQDFDILAVLVDTATAAAFADVDGAALQEQAFCDLAQSGTFVQAQDATFNSGPVRIENAGLIEIED